MFKLFSRKKNQYVIDYEVYSGGVVKKWGTTTWSSYKDETAFNFATEVLEFISQQVAISCTPRDIRIRGIFKL